MRTHHFQYFCTASACSAISNCSFKVKTNKDFVSVALNIVTTFWAPNLLFFLALDSVTSLLPIRPQTLEVTGVPVSCFQSRQGCKVYSLCREVSWEIWGGTEHTHDVQCFPLLLSVGAPRLHFRGFLSNWQPAVKRHTARPERSAALSSQSIRVFHWWLPRLQPQSQTETIQLLLMVFIKQARLHLTLKVEKEIKNYFDVHRDENSVQTGKDAATLL